MTHLLERAVTEVKKRPESEQDEIATLILDELADERLWQEAFDGSQEQLSRIAAKVRRDIPIARLRHER